MQNDQWPSGGGATGALMRDIDWAATPLGPSADWPASLRTLVDLVLLNPVPSALLWGADGILLYNDGYAAICGDRHPRALGRPVRDAWPEAWDFNGAMLAAGRAGRPQAYHDAHFLLERDGALRDFWFDLHYVPVVGGGDAYEGVLATVLDVTERVLNERTRAAQALELRQLNAELDSQRARLETSNQRLAGDIRFISSLFQSSPSFMAVLVGPDHRFELTNAAYDSLIQGRGVRGAPLREALPEVASQGFVDLLDRVYRDGVPFHGQNVEILLEREGGTEHERRILDFMYQPLKTGAGHTYGILVEGIDVTARALAEERLRVAQEAGEIGTFEWYPLRGDLTVSDTYRRLWGIAPDVPVTDALLLSLVDPASLPQSGRHRIGHMENPLAYAEYAIRRADTGELRWLARQGQPVHVHAQEEPRYLGVVFDVTDRKLAEQALVEVNESLERTIAAEVAERSKAEDALRQAQKMEAVGQLASGVAHDFNNVLQIVSSNLQLIERDAVLPARQADRLEQALAAVARGSRLSQQLLAFGRTQPLEAVVTRLALLLDDMRPLLQRALGDGVILSVDHEPGLWSVAVDRHQFENAVLNMALNARDAMGGTGRLGIALRNVPGADGTAHVRIVVADSGCGMAPDVLAKVFEPFYTTKEAGRGTGLGMSMVYGFVKQSGGAIRIDSTPGLGTSFTIDLPRVDGDHEAAPEAASAQLPGGHETVLLVDDDPAVRLAAVDLLAGLGYHVLAASDGSAALDILKRHAGIDLLFSDISMPGAVTSTDLVCEAVRLAPAMEIVLASGHAIDRTLLDERLPADLVLLPKPYTLAQLARVLRQHLDRGRPAPAAPAATRARRLAILVVEDDTDSRELACEMLDLLGHAVRGAPSAEQALAQLAEAPADVLFTDLNLPGMSGDRLAVAACALQPGLRVILASGEGIVDLALPTVMQLPKPYDLLQLETALAAIHAELLAHP